MTQGDGGYKERQIAKVSFFYFNRRHPVDFITQNTIVLCRRNTTTANNHQHPSMATCFGICLDHLQANIFQLKVQSVRTIPYGIPQCLPGMRKTNYKSFF